MSFAQKIIKLFHRMLSKVRTETLSEMKVHAGIIMLGVSMYNCFLKLYKYKIFYIYMLEYFTSQQISIYDIIYDVEMKFSKYNKKILKKIYNYVFKDKSYINDYFSYIWIKQTIFDEIEYLYDLECNLIILKDKFPNDIINNIRSYIQTNLIADFFLI